MDGVGKSDTMTAVSHWSQVVRFSPLSSSNADTREKPEGILLIKSSSNSVDDLVTVSTTDVAKWNYAPRSDWAEMSATDHFVQFYEADGFLLNSLSGFIGNAITAGGDAAIVQILRGTV